MQKSKNELCNRLEEFSFSVVGYCQKQSCNPVTKPLISQLVRSATSVGANYTEAQQAISRKDFTAKVFIAKKEAAETLYWLKILSRTVDVEELKVILQEAHEIMSILQSITIKLKKDNT